MWGRTRIGQLRFDGQGNLTFMAGPHQGFSGDVADQCAALAWRIAEIRPSALATRTEGGSSPRARG